MTSYITKKQYKNLEASMPALKQGNASPVCVEYITNGGMELVSIKVEVLQSLTKNLVRHESGNLIGLQLSDEETELLLMLVKRERPDVHIGSLPFLDTSYAFTVVDRNTKKSPTGRLRRK